MPRARNVKPAFFLHEVLAGLAVWIRLLFIGLWTLADREGRLADRPRRIQAAIFPYEPELDVDDGLRQLASEGFIQRYTVGGEAYLQVSNWLKHQKPHHQEPKSLIPCQTGSGSQVSAGDFGTTSEILRRDTDSIRLQPSTFNLQPATGNLQPESETDPLSVRLDGNSLGHDPYDWFVKLWPGGIPEDSWRVFAEKVNTPDRLVALRENAPLWAETKKYRDRFYDANQFLRSGVWLRPPNTQSLADQPSGAKSRNDEFWDAIVDSTKEA